MRGVVFISVLFALLQGCTTYHRLPINPHTPEAALSTPKPDRLKMQARKIRHPILKPVELHPEEGLSPQEAAIIAVLVNPGLRAERAKRGVSAAQLYKAGLLPDPQFSGSLDFPTAGATSDTVTAFGLALTYDVFSLITRGVTVNAARAEDASVCLDLAWKEWQVAEAAKQHAFRLALLEQEMAVMDKEVKELRANFRNVEKAFRNRDQTIVDLSAARTSLEKAHLSALGIRQRLVQERFALNKAIGFFPDHPNRLQPGIDVPTLDTVPAADLLMKGIDARRLDLLALRQGYASQEEQVRAAILEQFPAITIGINEARDTGNVVTTGAMLSFNLPFFSRNRGNIAVARATRKQLHDEYISRFYDAESAIFQLRADLTAIREQIDATASYLPSLENMVRAYWRALLQGNADVVNYYNARDELITTRISLLDLKLQFVDQFIALEIAAGRYLTGTEGEAEQ